MEEKKYQNDFLGSLHETAEGLYKIGVINDAEMREYDRNCLVGEDQTTPVDGTARSRPFVPAPAK
jgi:DNA-binding transcriptional regulator YiaG